jgi:predicted ATPase
MTSTVRPTSPLAIRLFGQFDVQVNGVPLPKLRSRKEKWLLALLVLEAGRGISRARLAQILWPFPDHSVDQAAYNLRRGLTNLRKALGPEAPRLQSPTPQTLSLDLTDAEVDVVAFDTACTRQDRAGFEIAAALYSGPLLEECTEEWAVPKRARYEQIYSQVLEELSAHPPLTLGRMESSQPSTETNASALPLSSFIPHPSAFNRLPIPLTTLVGREEQVQEVAARLGTVRLLTLTGAGGVGKTRLAIQVATERCADYADGVVFADLGTLTDPALLTQTVASALAVREEPSQPLLQTLIEVLHSRHLLLILDSCEHLVAACAHLAETLLQGCPRLHILATTRQPLGVSGEAVWRVPSLSLPDPRQMPAEDSHLPDFLRDYAAIPLFVERATLVQPTFQLTPQNARAIVQICRHLEGIPLAIELAAARVKALPIEQIARRLTQLFRLLTGGPRTALSRQQTLEATMQWSYDLLSEAERCLLRRLAVFAGGWTLEAAEAVCEAPSSAPYEVLDLLTSLVDKSLVVYEEQEGQARYRFLETVRQYSRERLAEDAEATQIGRRHLDFFLRLAEEANAELQGRERGAWLTCLQAEYDNLRAALSWALASGCASETLRLAGALWRFWHRRAYLSEGRASLASALALAETLGPTLERARACNGAGFLALHQGDNEAARLYFEESQSIGERLEDRVLIANSLYNQGYSSWYRNDFAAARDFYTQALALQRELGNNEEIALTLGHLGIVAGDLGDHAAARLYFDESLQIGKELGDKTLIANSLHSQGHTAFYQGDYAAARALYEEVLAIGRDLNDRARVAVSLHRLGNVAQACGDAITARRHFEESLALAREIEEKSLTAAALYSLGTLVRLQEDYPAAHALFAECLTVAQELRDSRRVADTLEALASLAAAQQAAD